jgi:hypothetical protein
MARRVLALDDEKALAAQFTPFAAENLGRAVVRPT